MNAFYQSVAGVLEVDSVGFDTKFRDLPSWCSLHAFGLLVMMENDYQAPMDIAALQQVTTVGELFLEAFCAFAAAVLKVDRDLITPETAYGSIPAWDSVNHLRLVMEAEKRFGVSYPLERIPSLKTIRDFVS